MRKFFGRVFLALAVLLIAVKAAAVALHPGSFSPRVLPNLYLLLVFVALLRIGRRLLKSQKRQLRTTAVLTLAAGTVTTAFVATIAWVDHGLAQRSYAGVVDDPHKIWAARGLVVEGPDITFNGSQNSIESIGLAFERGAKGSEVDVFFDAETLRFVVSHDRPYNHKNGALLTLAMLYEALGDRGSIWLDWKKLRHLNDEQLDAARAELESLTAVGERRARLYVEGEDPLNLGYFQRAGFHTIYDTHPLLDSHPLTPVIADLYKAIYFFGGHTVLGLNSGTREEPIYGPETRRALENVPVFVYHVPDDAEQLRDLLDDEHVRVILVQNHSLDRYSLRAVIETGAAAE